METIPAEVLGSIMDLSTYDVSCDLVDGRHGPLRFTQVSQLWRHTAIGLPSLWTNIQVEISPKPTNTYLVDLIEEILDRSKNLPLSVDLSLSAYNEVSVRLLDLLLGESERWASFSATLEHHENFLRLLPTMKSTPRSKSNHVTSLSLRMGYKDETFQLHLPNLLRLETSNTISVIKGDFPELCELFLHHEDLVWEASHIIDDILSTSTKLKYLTLFECLSGFYNDHLFRIIHATPFLEVLRLCSRGGRGEERDKYEISYLIAWLTTLRRIVTRSFPVLPHLTHLLLHLPKELAYEVRLISGSEMKSKIKSHAKYMFASPNFWNSRLRRIWIQDGSCNPGTSKLEKIYDKQIVHGVEVCIARPLSPTLGREVGLVVLSSSGEIISESVLRNYT